MGVDSSEPDLNEGMVGRSTTRGSASSSPPPADLKVFVLHHHLIPIPGTGRERSTVMDAGDLLEVLDPRRGPRGARRPQARPIRLAAREHVPRERRHVLVAPRAGAHQALLQRAGVRGRGGHDLPEVPVRRATADGARSRSPPGPRCSARAKACIQDPRRCPARFRPVRRVPGGIADSEASAGDQETAHANARPRRR